jgi:CheY-like chemotaxis protein
MSLTILYIEDNLGDVEIIKGLLNKTELRHELVHVDNFQSAKELVDKRNVDVVLLDLTLSESTGFSTLTQFLKKMPDMPVVVLTGTNNDVVGQQAVRAGAQDFLVKGLIDQRGLVSRIRFAIDRFAEIKKIDAKNHRLELEVKRADDAQEMAKFGHWTMDLISSKMEWSDRIFLIFGFQANSFDPKLSDYFRYVHNEDKPATEAFFERVANQNQSITHEHRIVVDGTKTRFLSITARIELDQITNNIRLIGGIQDITDRKQIEQKMLEDLLNGKANSLKDELLAEMSFNIRTPLSSVVQLGFLLSQTKLIPSQKELLDGLRESVKDLEVSLSNLFNFALLVSEEGQIHTEVFYLNNLLKSIWQVANIRAQTQDLQFQFNWSEALPERILCDQKMLTQILYNLVEFGFDKKLNAGFCRIETEKPSLKEQEQQVIRFVMTTNSNLLPSAKIYELISSDKLISNFKNQPEESAQRSYLPLAIASLLARRMGGTLDIAARPSQRSHIITVTLPVQWIIRSETINQKGSINKPLRVLLVEDHHINQIATRKLLTNWSNLITVDIAENGIIGVEKFRANPYDLILMDIQMPIMNGFEATSRIREENAQIPIIALTAAATRSEADRCRDKGMNDYLAKPYKPEDLFEKILLVVGS